MAESEASGEASVDDPVERPIDTDPAPARGSEAEDGPPPEPGDHAFDAFNATTWNFSPAPIPWYRTRLSVVATCAVSIAVIALVVSAVLLVVHRPPPEESPPVTATSSVPTTVTTPPTTRVVAPPLPPPPPPPTASQIERAPSVGRPSSPPRQTRKPEFNVTRTPTARSSKPSTKPPGR